MYTTDPSINTLIGRSVEYIGAKLHLFVLLLYGLNIEHRKLLVSRFPKCGLPFTFKIDKRYQEICQDYKNQQNCSNIKFIRQCLRYKENRPCFGKLIRLLVPFYVLFVINQKSEIKNNVQVVSQSPCLLGHPV